MSLRKSEPLWEHERHVLDDHGAADRADMISAYIGYAKARLKANRQRALSDDEVTKLEQHIRQSLAEAAD